MSKILRIQSRLRDYQVHFVENCAKAISDQKTSGAFLIIDQDLPGAKSIIKLFDSQRVILFKANEQNKTLSRCADLIQKLVDGNVRKNNKIYAVGGGVVEDVAAFVSTVLFRGVQWVFCPTTLLAQADSCIGSKSSINFGKYKNLLGAFYPPSQVIVDVNFLKTLPEEEIRSGLGEILHFYLVAGKVQLAAKMMARQQELIKNPRQLMPYIIESLKTKKRVIERDEFDQGIRNLFNYGHTFGHAIESVTNYKITHGQAVTMGMDIANYLSLKKNLINERTFQSLHLIFKDNLPKFRLNKAIWPQYVQALSKDKKNAGKTLGCILTHGPGKMFKTQLPFDQDLKKNILAYFETH